MGGSRERSALRKLWNRVIVGLFLLIVFLAAPTIVSLQLRSRAVSGAAATSIRFLSALDAHDYAGACALILDAPQQRATTFDSMQRGEEDIRPLA